MTVNVGRSVNFVSSLIIKQQKYNNKNKKIKDQGQDIRRDLYNWSQTNKVQSQVFIRMIWTNKPVVVLAGLDLKSLNFQDRDKTE